MLKPKAFSPRQREFWNQIRDFIHDGGGWITSEPHTSLVRFEAMPGSNLPELLSSRGYDVIGAGSGERLLPTCHTIKQAGSASLLKTQTIAPTAVDIFQFKLPFD
jgi:hypothetical protein